MSCGLEKTQKEKKAVSDSSKEVEFGKDEVSDEEVEKTIQVDMTREPGNKNLEVGGPGMIQTREEEKEGTRPSKRYTLHTLTRTRRESVSLPSISSSLGSTHPVWQHTGEREVECNTPPLSWCLLHPKRMASDGHGCTTQCSTEGGSRPQMAHNSTGSLQYG
jgi:hypothetical protein